MLSCIGMRQTEREHRSRWMGAWNTHGNRETEMPKPLGQPRVTTFGDLIGGQSASIQADDGFYVLFGLRQPGRTNKVRPDGQDGVDRHDTQTDEILGNCAAHIGRLVPSRHGNQLVV